MSIGLETTGIPMVQESLSSILVLNDDCLLKILDNLNAMDLCAVNDTCKRFRQLSDNHFQRQYSCKPFLLEERITSKPRRVNRILNHFGKHINKLIIRSKKSNRNLQLVLQLISMYCGQHLQEVELRRISLNGITEFTWKTLLSHVERLSVYFCRGKITILLESVRSLHSLKELELIKPSRNIFFDSFFKKHCYALQSLILKNSRDNFFSLRDFQKNLSMKKMRVIDYYYSMEWVIADILKYSRNIEEIAIQILLFTSGLERILPRLSELEKLKHLEFNCGGITIAPLINLLAKKNIMEYFSISCTDLNEDLCEALSKMKSLKTLKLISMTNEYRKFTKILSRQLLQLERFYIVGSNVFTLTDAVEMIENIPNLMWLVVKDCNQFMTIGCIEFHRIAQARKRKYCNQLIKIYLDQSALNSAIEEIPQQMREENSGYIKLMSTLRPEIRNEDFIVDHDKIWFNKSLRYVRQLPLVIQQALAAPTGYDPEMFA